MASVNLPFLLNFALMKRVFSNPVAESWLILAVVVAGCLALSLCAQPLVDDWIYMTASGRTFDEFWSCSGEPARSFADVLRNCWYHYLHTNGRLTDKLFIIASTSLPLMLARIFCLLMFGIGLCALLRLAGGRKVMSSSGFVAVFIALCLLLPPWEHYMISLACEFNYMVPMGLCFPVMLWMVEMPRLRWWMCVTAFLGGWTHESFSLAVCAAMGMLFLLDRFRLSRGRAVLAGCYLAGTLTLMLAPSTLMRIHDAPTQCVYPGWVVHSLATMPSLLIFAGVLLAAGVARVVRHRSEVFPWRRLLFLAAAAGVGITIGILTMERGRAFWFSDLVLVACTMLVLRAAWPSVMLPHRLFGMILGLAMASWLVWLSVTQYAYAREAETLSDSLEASPGTGIIWADVHACPDADPWELHMTQTPVNESFYNLVAMNCHYAGGKVSGQTVVLPTRFRGRHYTEWDSLPGGYGAYGSFPVYYVPRLSGGKQSPSPARVFVFSMERSPLAPANLSHKMRGVRSLRLVYSPPVIEVPSSRLRPGEAAAFRDPLSGATPDTLRFFYLERLPRPARYCPVDSLL